MQQQFLKQLRGTKCGGDGILVERHLSIRDFNLFSDGSTLTTTLTTNAGFAKAETNATVLQWAATKVVAVGFEFYLPFDYDESNDLLELHLKAGMGGSTDTPGLTANIYRKRDGLALTADLGPLTAKVRTGNVVATAALAIATTTLKNTYFDLSGLKNKGGDCFICKITPGAHGTDALNVYGVKVRLRSDIVAYSEVSPNR